MRFRDPSLPIASSSLLFSSAFFFLFSSLSPLVIYREILVLFCCVVRPTAENCQTSGKPCRQSLRVYPCTRRSRRNVRLRQSSRSQR
ncbi:hypothetical protein GGR52DRAFT_542383 [Hypoxylon sp. FL1284]|nr:hypothetical protein GGR52DRAFT_542383 [Hypoxylon sp. FL1284]